MSILYSFFVYLYYLAILIAGFFNGKAKKWLKGRHNLFEQLSSKLKNEKNIVWVHCASVGEFEQGRPLIEYLKTNTEYKVLLTFFSPSGYELRKNYTGADFIFYLPLDTPYNARKFIKIVNPAAAIIIKYEFWFNLFNNLKKSNIPLFLVSAKFRPNQYFFKWYGHWFCKQLQAITHIFVQDQSSEVLLKSAGIKNVTVAGDTRVDRVIEISKSLVPVAIAAHFSAESKLVIAGSTWPADEALLINFINQQSQLYPHLKFIIVPHEIKAKAITTLIASITSITAVRYSEAGNVDLKSARALIVDNIGLLSSIYPYGKIAYIGGGFGKGIHNILEAAVFGLPVLFGPNYKKFNEALQLIAKGGAYSVTDENSFSSTLLTLLNNENEYKYAQQACIDYVALNKGATVKIISTIKNILITKGRL